MRERAAMRWGWRATVAGLGAVGALSFAPLHIWPAALVALAGLYWRVMHVAATAARPGRSAFGTGLLFGLGWFSASCFWIADAFVQRGPEFIVMIPPLVGGLAVLLSLFWGVACALTARVTGGRGVWLAPLAFASAFSLAELARGHVLSGFPWNLPAYAFAPGGWVSQVAAWIGVYGLSFVIVLGCAWLGAGLRARDWRPCALGAGLLASLAGLGALRLGAVAAPGALPVQPGVVMRIISVPFRQSEQFDPVRRFQIGSSYIAASTAPGIEDVSHLIWPEGAVPGFAIDNESLLRAVGGDLAVTTERPPVWIMNSLREEVSPDPRTGEPRSRIYNSSVAVTFDANGNPAIHSSNDKRKLVPFGEFIPGGEVVEALGARVLSTALGSITGAPEKRAARFPGLPLGSPQICYEVIFPGLTPRGGARPEFILNQSNDAWFGAGAGPQQHAAIARYRAIEERVPLVRAAANGVSGMFDPYGREVARVYPGQLHVDTVLPLPGAKGPNMALISGALALLNLCLVLIARTFGRGGVVGRHTAR